MNLKEIQSQIQGYSEKTEEIFMNLGERFPLLLNREENSSMDLLLNMFSVLETANQKSSTMEKEFFDSYDQKYKPLFLDLNDKITELSNVNSNVRKIKENSEEMELIALNAMVISIKSGEKGRAFSSITESLKQLSSDMNIYSNKLREEERELLKQIKELKTIFDSLMSSQKELSSAGFTSASDVSSLITKASGPLKEIKEIISSVYPPIQSAMEGLQMQDIIRQALEHIHLCLDECGKINLYGEVNENLLDNITFNISLLKLSVSVLEDICRDLKKSSDVFKTQWTVVLDILQKVEPKRIAYINRFLDRQNISDDNIYSKMTKLNGSFSELLSQFGLYQASQKTLERNCNSITEKAHQMYAVFEALKPIIDRLHHVRILQQIEVAKNTAISSVKDSVTDMDNLINEANNSLDEMQDMLNIFISNIGNLLNQFTMAIRTDSEQMNKIRLLKNTFFTEFKNVQDGLSAILSQFSVFPPGFEQQCVSVQTRFDEFEEIYTSFRTIMAQMAEESLKLESKKTEYMKVLGVNNWELKDNRLKDLVKHFTIAAHKEEAGQIGHFGVEGGVESGEITFF